MSKVDEARGTLRRAAERLDQPRAGLGEVDGYEAAVDTLIAAVREDERAKAYRGPLSLSRTHPARVGLWDAINAFADAGRGVYGNTTRQRAVVEVERAIDGYVRAIASTIDEGEHG